MFQSARFIAFWRSVLLVVTGFAVVIHAHSQITITGVADRQSYTGSATFRVVPGDGSLDQVTLNGQPLASGVTYTVRAMDYYDLAVRRVDGVTDEISTALVRFIVISSNRGSPERGLIEWVPYPPISSASEEFDGASFELLAPAQFPANIEVPVVARVWEANGQQRRVNGWVNAPGFGANSFRVVRGVGFGFLPAGSAGSQINFDGSMGALQASRQIAVDSSANWTPVSGVLGADTEWAANSRIRVTGNLTVPDAGVLRIGAGTVVLLDPGVNVTNSGRTEINGTASAPVVFTAATRVAPEQRTGAWGGWIMRGTAAKLIANYAIMTGSGAAGSFSFSPGSSHRSEQALLFVHSGATVAMTNCALINNAGQIGNGYFSTITWDRCLLQKAITTGEYEGCTNVITRSAVIEFPSIDGVYNPQIADADFDGIYMIRGTNYFEHSLFGFAKDDAIDSGSGGSGTVVVTNCWVESALHEALAWSGEGRQTWTYDTILMNNGQGIECGWSTGSDSPLCWGERLLSIGNSVGARYGDNYEGTSGLGLKTGFLWVTNSIILNNYRDVWGQVWDNTWNYRAARMEIRDNYLTAPNTNHPNNAVWNPAADGSKLAPYLRVPASAKVGVGFANWNALTTFDLTNGVPMRLSTFSTRPVSVEYAIQTAGGTLSSGTVTFQPGETVKRVYAPISGLGADELVRVALRNPNGCEITSAPQQFIVPASGTSGTNQTLIALGAEWKFFDRGVDQGTAWRGLGFDDSSWSTGCAQLGYNDGDECTVVSFGPNSGAKYPTTYFRRTISIADPLAFTNLNLRVLRDDGAVVYVNGVDVFRSPTMPQPPTPIVYTTLATNLSVANAPSDNTIDQATISRSALVAGQNVIAVEVHQHRGDSSDLSFDLELVANLVPQPQRLNVIRFGEELVLHWADAGYVLESSDALGSSAAWSAAGGGGSPVSVSVVQASRFYRLRKP